MTAVRGRRASALAAPHHDGSELYVVERPDDVGGTATVRLRTPRGAAEQVWLRFVTDGEPRTAEAVVDEESGDETWWRAEMPVPNPAARYRWLVDGGTAGYRWVNGYLTVDYTQDANQGGKGTVGLDWDTGGHMSMRIGSFNGQLWYRNFPGRPAQITHVISEEAK